MVRSGTSLSALSRLLPNSARINPMRSAAPPTIIISGPIFSKFAARWVDLPVPELFITSEDDRVGDRPVGGNPGPSHGSGGVAVAERARVQTRIRPRFSVTLSTVGAVAPGCRMAFH